MTKPHFAILAILLLSSPPAANAEAQSKNTAARLATLRTSTKLTLPDRVLKDFDDGAAETPVIVRLHPTAAANELAARSKAATTIPAGFEKPDAPPYYDLRKSSVRTELHAAVRGGIDQAFKRLDPTGIRRTRSFSYQFGFAARVTPEALERIVALPQVQAVEKDEIRHAQLAQGIPLMNGTAARSSHTGAGISIAICDTGIDTSHPRLGGGGFPNAKVIGGYDTGDQDADPRPDSISGHPHGTACAGIAAGDTGTTGDYIGGVAPNARLYAIKVSSGTDGSAYDSAIIAGWEWAIAHQDDDPANPIMIISTSFGGGQYSSVCDSTHSSYAAAAANAVAAGITIFASAGNDGYCGALSAPACISKVNSVGAVYDDALGDYGYCVSGSSCAAREADPSCDTGYIAWDTSAADRVTSYSNSASFLTLFAPSHDAYTTDIVGTGGATAGDYDTGFGGTSAATPYAAGAAAVLQQAAKARTGSYLTPSQVRSYLVNNGDNVTDGKVAVTRPRVNLGRAINSLPGSDPTPAVASLSVTIGGDGTGSVNSVPSGIACTSGTCSATFGGGSTVTLTATPAVTSLFGGWTGDCTNEAGTCVLTMSAARAVVATFTVTPPARIAGDTPSYHHSLTAAYGAMTAGGSGTIQTREAQFAENPVLDRGIGLLLQGGYDVSYSSNTGGYSTISGSLSIVNGAVTVERFVIR